MSYIDLFKHSVVGEIVGFPVYKLEQDIEEENVCIKCGQYVIGGGSGEFPMLLINSIVCCKKIYLDELVDDYLNDDDDDDEYIRPFDNLVFIDWSMYNYHYFYQKFLENGYEEGKDGYLEYHINYLMGKLILENEKKEEKL